MEQEGANAIIDGAKSAFGTPILLGRVRAREAQQDAMFGIEHTSGRVVELFAIVSLNAHDRTLKLCLHKGMKGDDSRKNIRLVSQRKCPHKM